jgi:hypothetical protein
VAGSSVVHVIIALVSVGEATTFVIVGAGVGVSVGVGVGVGAAGVSTALKWAVILLFEFMMIVTVCEEPEAAPSQ